MDNSVPVMMYTTVLNWVTNTNEKTIANTGKIGTLPMAKGTRKGRGKCASENRRTINDTLTAIKATIVANDEILAAISIFPIGKSASAIIKISSDAIHGVFRFGSTLAMRLGRALLFAIPKSTRLACPSSR